MKKLLSLLCVLSLSLSLLAGCTPTAETESTPPASPDVSSQPVEMDITALKGPTAMGMVSFMKEADSGTLTDHNYTFHIVASADEASAALGKGTTDIAAVPANLASVLCNNTDGGVKVLAINTLGVLYIVENGTSIQSVADLKGKTIYASGKGTTPEYALHYILQQNGLDPSKDVTIEWKSEQAECLSALMASENGIAMLPQPFVTTAQSKSEDLRVALDLTEEWDKLQEGNDSPSALVTGVVVARTEFIEAHPEAVSDFLDHYQDSVSFVTSHVEEAASLVGEYDIVPAEVAQKALPACNITFLEGEAMKEKLSGYLSVLFAQNPQSVGGSLPDDDFYYSR